ncbi:TetR/AcrR family transcriptional regulator [Nonomuraea sp. KM88]|uniref:TetR/AcrR family transcriptional regulator n=1 Tax=Nonomuraea sp. KM88 TaxID=3457427 RepID=UPI003FCD42F8
MREPSLCDLAEASWRAGLVRTQLLGVAFVRYVVELAHVVSVAAGCLIRDITRSCSTTSPANSASRPEFPPHPARRRCRNQSCEQL